MLPRAFLQELFYVTSLPTRGYKERNGGGGIRTPSNTSNSSLHSANKNHTKQTQKLAKSNTCKNHKNSNLNKTSTSSEQDNNTSLHKKCAIRVHHNLYLNESNPFPKLLELIQVWAKLPEQVKTDIGLLAEPYRHETIKSKTST